MSRARLNNLADLYERRAATRRLAAVPAAAAIREAALGANHPDAAISLNNLASLYQTLARTTDALPLTEKMLAGGRAQLRVALPCCLRATAADHAGRTGARQRAQCGSARHQSSAASAVNKLAVRLAAGTDRLAQLVRAIRISPAKPKRWTRPL